MATDGSEFKACCRLRPRATGPGPASQFVLVPSSSPLGSSTEGRIAGDAGESLPLQDGDNIVEIVERDTVGVGLDSEVGMQSVMLFCLVDVFARNLLLNVSRQTRAARS